MTAAVAGAETVAPHVVGLDAVRRCDVDLVGGKGANLGEMIAAGFPVPAGFVVTSAAFLESLDRAGVRSRLSDLERSAANASPAELSRIAEQEQGLVSSLDPPESTVRDIVRAYDDLGGDGFVAVRSSATSEDTADTSFAGMNETFTNVHGPDDLIAAVRRCWASLYGARVVAYRAERGVADEPRIAVVVQQMVSSDRSGVMFTVDPAEREQLVIEAAFGLGEVVVSGQVEPDTYHLDRRTVALRVARVGRKQVRILRDEGGERTETLDEDRAWQRVLPDDDAVEVAQLGLAIERHYDSPQDIEWAYVGDELFIVQSRPITTLVRAGSRDVGR